MDAENNDQFFLEEDDDELQLLLEDEGEMDEMDFKEMDDDIFDDPYVFLMLL